jgi:hypothetical protein
LLPRLTYLKLDQSGFELCTMGRRHKIAWSDITDLQLVSVQGNQMVGFNYTPGYTRLKTGRRVASALSGVEGALPSHYNMPTSQLLNIMLSWHSRYGKPAI